MSAEFTKYSSRSVAILMSQAGPFITYLAPAVFRRRPDVIRSRTIEEILRVHVTLLAKNQRKKYGKPESYVGGALIKMGVKPYQY